MGLCEFSCASWPVRLFGSEERVERAHACFVAVVETHPESLIDLRIHTPFPELVEYARTFDYATMDSKDHGHVPAVVILVKAFEEWRAAVSISSLERRNKTDREGRQHEGKGPETAAERKEFAQAVMKQKRNSDEENFDEAVTLFRRAGTKTAVRSSLPRLHPSSPFFAGPIRDPSPLRRSLLHFHLLFRASSLPSNNRY